MASKMRSDSARVCFGACARIGCSSRVAILATDIFVDFLTKYPTFRMRQSNSSMCKKSLTKYLDKYLLLHTMSCIQLASKNILVNESVKISEIQELLAEENHNFSTEAIIKSEFIVFETIGFHVPHRTMLDEIEYLIDCCVSPANLNIDKLNNACVMIFKLLYLLNEKFYSRLKWTLGKKDFDDSLLPSAIVSAACKIVFDEKSYSETLCKKTNNAAKDIEGIANIILVVIFE